ncbi:MAG: hypothetical protein VKN83_04545 [Cyanobacteriota bacterium]|nr:hypothetical protein [Cyanobacteriota bacterium]
MGKKRPLPILLMPVYKGGVMFEQAIDSVIPCLPWFSRVVISLNGNDTHEDRAIAVGLAGHCDLTLLETRRILNPVQHLHFIAKYLSQKMLLAPDSQLFVLCHDDLLYKPGFDHLDQKQWEVWGSDCISLGDYHVFKDDTSLVKHRDECWFARYDSQTSRSKQAFLMTQYQRNDDPFTNFSGMRFSLSLLRSTIRFFTMTGSNTGMRLEYSLIVNRQVKVIKNFNPPLVAVREHSGSAGAKVTRSDFTASELRYGSWIWVNCESPASLKQIYHGQYGPKGMARLVRISLLHRYYELLGWARLLLVSGGLIRSHD